MSEIATAASDEAADVLGHMISGFRVSQMVRVAAQLDVPDLLADGPLTCDALAQRTGSHPTALQRLLRALCSLDVFHQDADGRFALTPISQLLRSDVPGSLRGWATFVSDRTLWQAWGALDQCVRTGDTGFAHVFGTDVWSYRAQHLDTGAIFNAAMSSLSARDSMAVLAAYNFASFGTIVDICGGQGALLAAILTANPGARGVIFDLPHVVATATPLLQATGVADRCDLAGGSFFEAVPSGGDAYLLRYIIHDWDDERSIAILRTCRAAMAAHARLLVIEAVLKGPNVPDPARILDINMLVMPGGRERSADEYGALLAQSGLTLVAIHPTPGSSSVIEAVPA